MAIATPITLFHSLAYMSTLSERLREAMDDANIGQSELARRCNVKQPSVSGWLSGKSKFLRGENLLSAAEVLNVRDEWLATGRGPKERSEMLRDTLKVSERWMTVSGRATPSGYVRFQLLEGAGGMGDGAVNTDYPEVIRDVDIAEWEVRRRIGFVPKPGRIKLLTGRGPSMRPRIDNGDVVMVDTEVNSFEGDAIYVIVINGETQIKALQMRGDGLYVVSINPDFPPYPATDVHVRGKVLGVMGVREL